MQLAILAADFTPGEADALRRAMAAWKRGGLGPFHERLVGRMLAKGLRGRVRRGRVPADRGLRRVRLPESHAASFALLSPTSAAGSSATTRTRCSAACSTASRWASTRRRSWCATRRARRRGAAGGRDGKRRRGDARRRHGWRERRAAPVRLGLNQVAGLSARRPGASSRAHRGAAGGPPDLARRAMLDASCARSPDRRAACRCCPADAAHRHQAAWAVAGVDAGRPRCCARRASTRRPRRAARAERDRGHGGGLPALGLTLARRPWRCCAASSRRSGSSRRRCFTATPRAAGARRRLVRRQRPRRQGTVFVTLEDETGAVNVISGRAWPGPRRALVGTTLLTVYGTWQREGEGRSRGDASSPRNWSTTRPCCTACSPAAGTFSVH